MKIIDKTQSYTFNQFFDLKIKPEKLAKEFGYTFTKKYLDLLYTIHY